jgi:hypothetical protein
VVVAEGVVVVDLYFGFEDHPAVVLRAAGDIGPRADCNVTVQELDLTCGPGHESSGAIGCPK